MKKGGLFIKKQSHLNVKKGKKNFPTKRKTDVKVIVVNELNIKRAVQEFYKVVKSEQL